MPHLPPFTFSSQVSRARRFYLEINQSPAPVRPKAPPFGVIGAGWEECLPEYDLKREGFPYPIIELIIRGNGSLELDGKQYPLTPGTLFSYGNGVPHRIRSESNQPLVKYFAVACGPDALNLFGECHILPGSITRILHPDQLKTVFDDLLAYGLSDHSNRSQMCITTFQYLLMKIGGSAIPYGDSSSNAFATYQRCREFIEENFLNVRTLGDIAEACHIDAAYLCRLFKKFRRQPPYQYLQNLQMNHAADLLQNGQHTIKEVGASIGFPDPYNFSRTFKRVFGIAPSFFLGRNPLKQQSISQIANARSASPIR